MQHLRVSKVSYLLMFFLLAGCRMERIPSSGSPQGSVLQVGSPTTGEGSPRIVMEAARACGRKQILLRVENFSGRLGGGGLVFRFRSSMLQIHALNPGGNVGALVGPDILWNVLNQYQPGWSVWSSGQDPIPIPAGFSEFRSSYLSPNISTGTPVRSGDVLLYLDATVNGDPEIEFTWENEFFNEQGAVLSFEMQNSVFGCD
jgi:hypothetical protein